MVHVGMQVSASHKELSCRASESKKTLRGPDTPVPRVASVGLLEMPEDILAHIGQFLEIDSLLQARLGCRALRSALFRPEGALRQQRFVAGLRTVKTQHLSLGSFLSKEAESLRCSRQLQLGQQCLRLEAAPLNRALSQIAQHATACDTLNLGNMDLASLDSADLADATHPFNCALRALQPLTHLHSLSLLNCNLRAVPEGLSALTQLRHLNLDYNKCTELPAWVGGLHHLTVLRLQDNQLQALPPSLSQLTALQLLAVNDNPIAAKPAVLNAMPRLKQVLRTPTRGMQAAVW
jgi:hypothetical protein